MKALKSAMIVMGVLIVALTAVLVVELIRRANDPERRAQREEERAAAVRPVETALGLPDGARMGEPVAVGNRIALRVSVPGGHDRLYLLDPRTGAVQGTLTTGHAASLGDHPQ